jgi:hypothetical protein
MIEARAHRQAGRRASRSDVLGWQAFTPLELLALGFVLFAAVVGLIVGAPIGRFIWHALVFCAALGVVALAIVRIVRLDPTLGRWLAGVSLTFAIYGALPPWLDGLTNGTIDGALERMETVVFGQPVVYLLQPYVADHWTLLFGLAYAIHLPLFFVSATLHWSAGRREQAERLLLTLAIAMYLGFVGYALFPALGPVGAAAALPPMAGNLATQIVASHGVALGTFPSLHAGVSTAVALDAWRTSRRWGVLFTTIAALVWASTLYLRYHWVPDLLAGVALAIVSGALAARLHARWSSQPS